MGELWFPYGATEVPVRVPEENLYGVIEPKSLQAVADVRAEILRALDNPIGSKKLAEMAGPDDRVAIVVDDYSRPVPSSQLLPVLLDELNRAGVKDDRVSIIIATGVHRPATSDEIQRLVGEEVVKRVTVRNHDCRAQDLVEVGTTNLGVKVKLNKVFAEASVRILTGDVSLHYHAGYGGGRKSVLPGISGFETIQANHALFLKAKARTGVLDGNQIDKDMNEAADMARINLILNIVQNKDYGLVRAFAGDLHKAFLEGVKVVEDMCKVEIERPSDILIVSPGGSPLDMNLYQSLRAIQGSLEIVKDKGVVILIAECAEGHGNQVFADWMNTYKKMEDMETEIKKRFTIGGHKAYQLAKMQEKVRIILVSVMPDFYSMGVFRLRTGKTANEALHNAFNLAGKNSKVWAIPRGSMTLPSLKGPSAV
jgi:lactate racemase